MNATVIVQYKNRLEICCIPLKKILLRTHEEYATEAFKKFDKDGAGFISALDFQDIMLSIKSHLLTKDVRDNLIAVSIMRTNLAKKQLNFHYFLS